MPVAPHPRSRSSKSGSRLGLDDPKHEQFLRYMAGVFTPYENEEKGVDGPFDLGTSFFQNNKPVREIIFDRLPATVFLVTGAVVIWLGDRDPRRDHLGGEATGRCSTARR